jgi:PAS domain S-box-containing protein
MGMKDIEMTPEINEGKIVEGAKAVGTIAGGIAAVYAGWKVTWPRIKRVILAQRLAESMFDAFGADAADKIKNALVENRLGLARAEARLNLICKQSNLGVYICDKDGRCTFANDFLCEMFGLDSDRMKGYGWLACVQDRESEFHHWKFAVENDTPYRSSYTIMNQKTKLAFKVNTQAEPHREGGVPVFYIGLVKAADETSKQGN